MIHWRDGEERLHEGSLFGVFAALARGEAWSFPALRPHQREPWHAFTVQVAALALIHAGRDDLPGDEATWRDLLISLTPDHPDGEAWTLVVDDWSKPALLQPPVVAEANRAEYKNVLRTPDALDMLVTSRNHDVKQERIANASDEDWLFALVTLQTMEGQMGRGNYGISRMNTGFGNRPTLGIRSINGGATAAFRRDVRRLLSDASDRPDRRAGLSLLWTDAWDGTVEFDYTRLDELYVEICRRVRLRAGSNGWEAIVAASAGPRVAADSLGGNTKDPWMPLVIDTKKDRKTVGQLICAPVSAAGFGYRQMSQLMNAKKTTAPLLAHVHKGDGLKDLAIVASALVRGQGKTEGLHRRVVHTYLVEKVDLYDDEHVLDRIGDVAMRRSLEAAAASGKLKYALLVLLQGAPTDPGESKQLQVRVGDAPSNNRADVWIARFDREADSIFFGKTFWAEVADHLADYRLAWRKELHILVKDILAQAAEAAPRTEMRRIRAIARSRSVLDAQMSKWLGEIA